MARIVPLFPQSLSMLRTVDERLVRKKDLIKLCELHPDREFLAFTSGTFQSAQLAVEELRQKYPERTILCLDTLYASVGEGFLVREAVRK